MISMFDLFQTPGDEGATIWRYMTLSKFLNLLSTSELYFPSAASFSDPYEGLLTTPTENKMVRESFEYYLHRSADVQHDWDRNEKEAKIRRSIRDTIKEEASKLLAVSCWNMSSDESAALWQLYASSSDGVAIRSTYQKLRAVCDRYSQHKILIGKVLYLDYQTCKTPVNCAPNDLLAGFMCKRKSFRHEEELRAIVDRLSDYHCLEDGADRVELRFWDKKKPLVHDSILIASYQKSPNPVGPVSVPIRPLC